MRAAHAPRRARIIVRVIVRVGVEGFSIATSCEKPVLLKCGKHVYNLIG